MPISTITTRNESSTTGSMKAKVTQRTSEQVIDINDTNDSESSNHSPSYSNISDYKRILFKSPVSSINTKPSAAISPSEWASLKAERLKSISPIPHFSPYERALKLLHMNPDFLENFDHSDHKWSWQSFGLGKSSSNLYLTSQADLTSPTHFLAVGNVEYAQLSDR